MQFSTIVASTLALVLATSTVTVSAQNPTDACLTCIVNAALARSPSCSLHIVQQIPAVNLGSPPVRACICPLTISGAWMDSCFRNNICTAIDIVNVFENIGRLREEACSRPVDAPVTPAGNPTIAAAPAPTISNRSSSGAPTGRPTTTDHSAPTDTSVSASATASASTSTDLAAPSLPVDNTGVPMIGAPSNVVAGAAIAMAVAFTVLSL
ncbi:hypothetical protein BG015_000301 [Linnemannia schmuckeri]|uniref:Extracellular membrane protein CFEM domain-containing protein n=1 Tax=Linnemannia schmuckeri TaxID=64567 RepID=A0A9P5V7P5_9FUNG|nr:hypothetical protein BG015_000301 [Linnemannia schmuckeri]